MVPHGLDSIAASTVPLNGLTAAQIVDLLGEPSHRRNRLLIIGAAGIVGGYPAVFARTSDLRPSGGSS